MTIQRRPKSVVTGTVVVIAAVLSAAAPGMLPTATPSPDAHSADITDQGYLTQDLWNDGQAEIAFYRAERKVNQYGEPDEQRFLVGTYLVKHDFDPVAMTKARPDAKNTISSFKSAIFFEVESGSYQYKRNWVVNSQQNNLAPLKASFSSFDWCSNTYSELAVHPGGDVNMLMRSDDYRNAESSFAYRPNSYPVHAIPVLIRGLDFSGDAELAFYVMLESGDYVAATARLIGRERYDWAGGPTEAERIEVSFEEPVPSPFGETTDSRETYWRSVSNDRLLLGVESQTGRYALRLVEQIRSPYWRENLWPKLERVKSRP